MFFIEQGVINKNELCWRTKLYIWHLSLVHTKVSPTTGSAGALDSKAT